MTVDLTPVESELAEAVKAGKRLNLSRRADRVVRAEVIRDLIVKADADPLGVMLHGARIVGELDLDMVKTTVPLELTRCVFEERLTMFHSEVPAICMNESVLPGLYAEGLRTRHFSITNARVTDTLDLDNAHVDGQLSLVDSSLRTGDAVALRGDGLHVGRDIWLNHVLAESSSPSGTLRLNGCDVGGSMILSGAVVTSTQGIGIGIGLGLERATIAGSLLIRHAFVSAAGRADAMRMVGARIGGQVTLDGTVMRATDGPALCADGAHITSSIYLSEGFDAASASRDCTVRTVGAKIGGGVEMIKAAVRGLSGQAITLNKAKIEGSVFVHDARLEGRTRRASFDLTSTDIGGQLSFVRSEIINHGSGYDLTMFHTKVGRSFMFPVANLTSRDDFTATLNGLSYPEPPIGDGDWLKLLSQHVPNYEAQPYQQLAKVHRAAGHEQLARKILIAQQNDLRKRGNLGNRWAKAWHWFLGKTLGYGYQPSRAVAGLIATFVASIALVIAASWTAGTTPAKDRPADSCSLVNRVSLAADLAIPLVKLGTPPKCEFASTTRGQWFTAGGWVIQILGWSFATLSVAGFTGLVRKT